LQRKKSLPNIGGTILKKDLRPSSPIRISVDPYDHRLQFCLPSSEEQRDALLDVIGDRVLIGQRTGRHVVQKRHDLLIDLAYSSPWPLPLSGCFSPPLAESGCGNANVFRRLRLRHVEVFRDIQEVGFLRERS